ncbi:MAG: S41 family peptidase [Kurthia sp.]|nr:S41 family peptidase [Candidatus Kurthia equi]
MKKWAVIISSALSMMLFSNALTAQASEPIKEVKKLVSEAYYPNISTKNLNDSTTIKQLMSKLDPYSMYMTEAEMKEFESGIAMEFVGIGVTIIANVKGLSIVEVIKNSPASKSGFRAGDIITKINGISLAGKKEEEAINMLKGKVNSKVKLTILDGKTKKLYTKSVTRAKITMQNVESKKLAGNIGYLRLNSFSDKSATELQNEIKKMPTVKRWIFDLRGNGGGYIEAAEAIIGMFPNAEIAYAQKYAHEKTYYLQLPDKQKIKFKGKVALLIDKNSASASEMTAAALKGQKLATLYGQTTYGKGVAQALFQLANKKGFLKLTIAEFYGVNLNGKLMKINKSGVSPNVKTAVGQEVIVSHGALLKNSLKTGTQLKNRIISAKQQKIVLKPSKNMTWNQLKTADIHLYQWGGVTRKITLKKTGKQVIITAPKGLKKGTKYYLNINPTKGKSAYSYVRIDK